MNYSDTASMMRDIAPVIREHTASELKPLVEKIDALAKRVERSNSFDGKKFGEEITAAVRGHVEKKVGPLLERLERFEQRFDRVDQRIDAIALRGAGAAVDEAEIVSRAAEALAPVIDERVREAVMAMPAPKSITVDDVRPLIEAEVAVAVARLKPEKPASRNVAAMTINRSGILIAEIDDGEYRNLGSVVEQVHKFSFESAITDGVRALPRPETYSPC